jgi:hypothetical protein
MRPRRGRALNGRRAVQVADDMARPCPRCGAAKGWRCTKTVGLQVLPRKSVHPERKAEQ